MTTADKDAVPSASEVPTSIVPPLSKPMTSAVTANSAPSKAASKSFNLPPAESSAGGGPKAPAPPPAPVSSGVVTRRPAAAVAQPVTSMSSRAAAASKSKKKKGQPNITMATAPTSQSGSHGTQGENTGRWTAEEHRLFLQGLEQHGKGWKKIASLIKSRTVVQIRTHAQKYFQKLAKARQNGEEGDVTMEGRGGVASVTSVSTAAAAQTSKRRRQVSGTKRKAIQSVVASAQRQGKKMAAASAAAGVPNPVAPLPAVAPTLAHFVLPNASSDGQKNGTAPSTSSCVPSITTAQGTISGPALEDSLFRFLTPHPVDSSEPQVNDVARQAGANPISLPTDNPSTAPTVAEGEISPTGVNDLAIYPSWADAKDTPSWYAKGADVDALLDVGDDLDWLADTGDLHETYQPPPVESAPNMPEIDSSTSKITEELVQTATKKQNTSVSSLPHVDSNMESVVPPLPSIFDGTPDSSEHLQQRKKQAAASAASLHESGSSPNMEEHLQVFDSPMEEHDFVSTILENNNESSASLALQ